MALTPLSFTGITGPFLVDNKRSTFFKPYESPTDIAVRAASVITAPFILTGYSFLCAAASIYKLICAIGNTLTIVNAPHAVDNLKECGVYLFAAGLFIIAAPLSPLANLIDLIGSAFVKAPEQTDDHYENMSLPLQ